VPPTYSDYKITHIIEETSDIRTFRLAPVAQSPPSPAFAPTAPPTPGMAEASGASPTLPAIPSFKSGQFFILRAKNPPPELKPPFRSYSSLSPSGQPFIEFGIKKEGKFTTLLFGMKVGGILEVSGPYGLFILPDPITAPIVFLAGGIGITPLACHVQHLVKANHQLPFFLFYSNRHEEEISYKGLLDSLSDLNPNFHMIYALTCDDKECPASWKGERGRINAGMIRKHLNGAEATPIALPHGAEGTSFALPDGAQATPIPLPSCQFYLCGSPPFVTSLIEMLKAEGVPPEKIHKEQW